MPPDFDLLDVGVPNCPTKQRHRAESDRQPVALVQNGQMMEGRGKQGDEQAHAAGNEDARRIADQPGKSDAGQRRAVKDQAEWGFLRVGIARVGRHSFLPSLSKPDQESSVPNTY